MKNKKRIVFLDRDGVINYNPVYLDYVKSASEFKFLPGVKQAIKLLKEAGIDVIIISNQTGVGRGIFNEDDIKAIDNKMLKGIESSGGKLKKIAYCIHDPNAGCDCRKPKTGMFKLTTKGINIDKKNSFYIGDTERDVVAGNSFGIKTVLVLSGYDRAEDIKRWKIKPNFISKDLLTAVKDIIVCV